MTPEQQAKVSIDAPISAAGYGRQHFRVDDVERLPVHLLPVTEQARIVAEAPWSTPSSSARMH